MKKVLSAILILSSLIFVGCEDDDISNITIVIPFDQYAISTKSGNKEIIEISVRSSNGSLNNLTITERSTADGIVTLLDEALDSSSYSLDYIYEVPEISNTVEERTIKVTASNVNGDTMTQSLAIYISSSSVLLTEITSMSIYSASSNNACGYSFQKGQLVSIDGTTEDRYIDICDVANTTDNETLSCEWQSRSGLTFARLTGFNYSEATSQSVTSAYQTATKLDKITNIANDDIIFVGLDNMTPIAVIKVIAVIDEAGYASDRYIVSMKVLDTDLSSL